MKAIIGEIIPAVCVEKSWRVWWMSQGGWGERTPAWWSTEELKSQSHCVRPASDPHHPGADTLMLHVSLSTSLFHSAPFVCSSLTEKSHTHSTWSCISYVIMWRICDNLKSCDYSKLCEAYSGKHISVRTLSLSLVLSSNNFFFIVPHYIYLFGSVIKAGTDAGAGKMKPY